MTPDNQSTGSIGGRPGSASQVRSGTDPANFKFPDPLLGTGFNQPAITKKWCFDTTPVYGLVSQVNNPNLQLGTIVNVIRSGVKIDEDGLDPVRYWSEVQYTYFENQGGKSVEIPVHGWVDERYLDAYVEEFPRNLPGNQVLIADKLRNPNATPNSAQQYIVLGDQNPQVKFDLCGEFCVAYMVGEEIETVLQKWQNQMPNMYNKLVGPGQDQLTGADDLFNILKSVYNYTADEDIQPITSDGKALAAKDLKARLQEELQDYYFLALVKSNLPRVNSTMIGPGGLVAIDSSSKTDQRNHWVVVDASTHQGNIVEIYNPLFNRRETYDFILFYYSSNQPRQSGLWVKRTPGVSLPGKVNPAEGWTPQVGIETPAAPGEAARQYINVGGRKTELCGEFCVSYILTKSLDCALEYWSKQGSQAASQIGNILRAYGLDAGNGFGIRSVLRHWQNTPLSDYNAFVGNGKNEATSLGQLKQILRTYGYTENDLRDFPASLRDIQTPTDPRFDRSYVPPTGKISEMLDDYFLIVGVGIDGTGRLKESASIRHWVVLEEVHPAGKHYENYHREGDGGWVRLYNPFTNQIEEYSLLQLYRSMGKTAPEGLAGMGWLGLFISRSPQNYGAVAAWQNTDPAPIENFLQKMTIEISNPLVIPADVDEKAGKEIGLAKESALKVARALVPILQSHTDRAA
jgi:hypothetical protein